MRQTVVARLCEWYGLRPEDVTDDRPFADLGLTSRDAVTLAGELGMLTGGDLPATLLWESPTLGELTDRLCGGDASGAPDAVPVPRTSGRVERPAEACPVAVVGIGCRLPGADGPQAFWRLLSGGDDAVSTVPEGRWEPFVSADTGSPDLEAACRNGGFLRDIAGFDAEFFAIPPHEAQTMDPQQRMVLEVARESLDHAAIPAASLAGTATGVFVGISGNEYAQLTTARLDTVDAWTPPGAALSIAANRLSYVLDLRGPSLAIDTACSSSLVAVHHAVRSLASGESDTALAAGVNLLLSPAITLAFSRAGALDPGGRCRAFDASAAGMVRGEGCAVVVLKRLADAERDRDRILAVIRSTAVNSDGRSNGLLAPSPDAQRALLTQAYARTGPVPPEAVDYLEAHGTGTPLGDPIEAGALGAVLGANRDPDQPLLIGSVKSNVGHLEAAAGITGLVKTVLALAHDEIPPSLHFTAPNPRIDFDSLRLRVVTAPEPWPRYSGTATAGVSAFGFGGTNAHVVLQEYRPVPADPLPDSAAAPAVLLIDGDSPDRVREYAGELGHWMKAQPPAAVGLADVGRTLAGRTGRGRFRAAVVTRDRDSAAEGLATLAAGRTGPGVIAGDGRSHTGCGPVWVFPGYGSQWPGMGHQLLTAEPAFAAAVDLLEPLLLAHAGVSLRANLEPGAELRGPAVVQPVLFGVQVALAELWRAHGVQPAAVIGHSMGEVAAAVVAGALSAEDGARVIAVRSRLLAGLSGGSMALVDLSAARTHALVNEYPSLRIAVYSSPRQSIITGTVRDVKRMVSRVTDDGGVARLLDVTAAGHSPQVDPLLDELTGELAMIQPAPPRLPVYSTVLDRPWDPSAFDAHHWAANLRLPVRFEQAVKAAAGDGHRVFVEVSAHPTQLLALRDTLESAGAEHPLLVPTLRRGTDDALTFRISLASLLVGGCRTPHQALHPAGRVTDVPAPRWRHRHHWIGAAPAAEPFQTPRIHDRGTDQPRPGDDGEGSQGTTVERLRRCIAAVTGHEPGHIDIRQPLTELGLDSLTAARIGVRAEAEFGRALPPSVLLRVGTVEAVAAWLDGRRPEAAAPATEAGRALPRDAVERAVALAWQAASDGPAPGVGQELPLNDDPSLRTRFADALTAYAGTRQDPAKVFRPPITVEALADRLRPAVEGQPAGPLRHLSPGGSGTPLFLAHPAGGSSAVYRTLAGRLGHDRPCYGLDRLTLLPSVGERAQEYARLIRKTTAGPWMVGGWSYGGLLAQETARLLTLDGGQVTALVLIDTILPLPPSDPGPSPAEEARRRFEDFADYIGRAYGTSLPLPFDELGLLDEHQQIDRVMKALEQAADLPDAVLEHQRTSYLDLRSGERHTPRPYAGRTVLYRATQAAPHTVRDARYERTDEALGWDAYCTDLTVVPLPGHHLSLLDPPVVDVLADRLTDDLGDSREL
ncbi:beta-ketoacyl synthase N-terminal-like domain-containing protein [Streptomyces sp. 7N604]|uniref:beta-ketoacyl synthase N-terminal-like domain-containing protein n=1 Tax=Streptomyces sp. 7N604 TaxID=3457415 RepID=UPI003FD17397